MDNIESEINESIIIDYKEDFIDLENKLNELLIFFQEQQDKEESEKPTLEDIENQELKIIEEQEQQELFQENLLKSNEDLLNINNKIVELLEISPDYSNVYEEQQVQLSNFFDAQNVLIGLILGVGVAIAFIKGLTK